MRSQQQESIEEKEKLWNSINQQIDRFKRMDESLYEDKLAGDISPAKYLEKHEAFAKQKKNLEHQLALADRSLGSQLDYTLVLLELSQKSG